MNEAAVTQLLFTECPWCGRGRRLGKCPHNPQVLMARVDELERRDARAEQALAILESIRDFGG